MKEEVMIPEYPDWKVVRLIGRGSFGAVYEIERDLFGTIEKAALKVITIPQSESELEELYSSGYDDESVTVHFRNCLADIVREYTLMADLKGHTNVVNSDDIRYVRHDRDPGWDIFIRMELLTPLTKALKDGAEEEQAVRLGRDMCTALALCRSRGIIHRDIKPQNIFISRDGEYKLGDFGIAKTIEKTSGGTKIGTYNYMAPEVYNNDPYGHPADLYSLGMVLYWLLNERRMPFFPLPPKVPTNSELDEARRRRFSGAPIPAPKHGSGELKQIVLRACAFDPAERYQTAEEMLLDLEALDSRARSVQPEDDPTVLDPKKPPVKKVPESDPAKDPPKNPPTGDPPRKPPDGPPDGPTDGPADAGSGLIGYLKKHGKTIAAIGAAALILAILIPKIVNGGDDTGKTGGDVAPVAVTAAQTPEPTAAPSAEPTAAPTPEPTAAPTAEPTPEPTSSMEPVARSEGNWSWTLADGVLTISGKGSMADFVWDQSPWKAYFKEIRRVVIEDGITHIGADAFQQCSNLEYVEIPAGVNSVGYAAFVSCYSLKRIEVAAGNRSFKQIDGVLYSYDGKTLVCFPCGRSDTSYQIADTVTTIGEGAFLGCGKLTEVKFPASVTSIGAAAFYNCGALRDVTLPEKLTSIGGSAFCYCTSLESVKIPSGVTDIPFRAFGYCDRLSSVSIPAGVTAIREKAFADCFALKDVYFAESRAEWEKITVGKDNEALENATIHCEKADSPVMHNVGNWSWTLGDGVLIISGTGKMTDYDHSDNRAPWYGDRETIKRVIIIEGITYIGQDAFTSCTKLESVEIPESVTAIGVNAFLWCYALRSVTLPPKLESIGFAAFFCNYALSSVEIPASVKDIGEVAFCGCTSLERIDIAAGNKVYKTVDGVLFTADGKTLMAYPAGKKDESYKIPSGVTFVGINAFSQSKNLKSVACENVSVLRQYAFQSCTALSSVTVTNTLTCFYDNVFSGCSALKDIYYTGSEAQWAKISIDENNAELFSAAIHFGA